VTFIADGISLPQAKAALAPGQLPDKPSELILVALADLEKVEASACYRVDMGVYHEPAQRYEGRSLRISAEDINDERCLVCFAGSVMAMTLDAPSDQKLWPVDFGDNSDKLEALDSFRCGDLENGFIELGIVTEDKGMPNDLPTCLEICPYAIEPATFKADMRDMAQMLAEAGY